jgi:hypothetical protein
VKGEPRLPLVEADEARLSVLVAVVDRKHETDGFGPFAGDVALAE